MLDLFKCAEFIYVFMTCVCVCDVCIASLCVADSLNIHVDVNFPIGVARGDALAGIGDVRR